jgi:hypothetical protein
MDSEQSYFLFCYRGCAEAYRLARALISMYTL